MAACVQQQLLLLWASGHRLASADLNAGTCSLGNSAPEQQLHTGPVQPMRNSSTAPPTATPIRLLPPLLLLLLLLLLLPQVAVQQQQPGL